MRIALSTLGCPGTGLDAAIDLATTSGFTGIELRAATDEPVHTGLDAAARAAAARALTAAGITPLAVASYVKVCDPGADDRSVIDAGLAHARLAHDLGARYLRVFAGGDRGRPVTEDDDRRGARRLARIIEAGAGLGVSVALETHDTHGRAADVRRIIDQDGCADALAVWDVLHSWLRGESPAASMGLLADRIAYVQVKDIADPGNLTPVSLGTGLLPLEEIAEAVRAAGYDGWVSWEYERRWFPDAPPAGDLAPGVREWIGRKLTPRD